MLATSPSSAAPTAIVVAATGTPRSTSTPRPRPTPGPPYQRLSPAAGKVVWAVAPEGNEAALWVSRDAGDRWERRGLSPTAETTLIPSVRFFDDREGWLWALSQPTTMCGSQPVTLWHTIDGAVSWERLPTGAISGRCKDALTFVDSLHGFATAYSPMEGGFLYRTEDGGHSWTRLAPLPLPPVAERSSTIPEGMRLSGVQAAGGRLHVAAHGYSHLYLYESTDAGGSWSYLMRLPGNVRPQTASVSLGVIDERTWVIRDPDLESPLMTTDGGASWQPGAPELQLAGLANPRVAYSNDQVAYLSASGVLRRTLDGGATWTDIPFPGLTAPTPTPPVP